MAALLLVAYRLKRGLIRSDSLSLRGADGKTDSSVNLASSGRIHRRDPSNFS
jgi:hypothetical protein